MIPRTLRRNF